MSDYTLDNSDYERLQRENERLKAELQWYAAGTNWEAAHYNDDGTFDYETIPAIADGGARASQALKGRER